MGTKTIRGDLIVEGKLQQVDSTLRISNIWNTSHSFDSISSDLDFTSISIKAGDFVHSSYDEGIAIVTESNDNEFYLQTPVIVNEDGVKVWQYHYVCNEYNVWRCVSVTNKSFALYRHTLTFVIGGTYVNVYVINHNALSYDGQTSFVISLGNESDIPINMFTSYLDIHFLYTVGWDGVDELELNGNLYTATFESDIVNQI